MANRFPYPPHRGDKLKIYNLAKRLSKKHKLILITFTQNKEDLQHKQALDSVFYKVYTVHLPAIASLFQCLRVLRLDPTPLQVLFFRSQTMKRLIRSVVANEKPDCVHVQHIRMAQYADCLEGVPAILDLPDAFSLYWKRRVENSLNMIERIFHRFEYKRIVRYEQIIQKFRLCLACSLEDIRHLKGIHKKVPIRLFPNGVDLNTFSDSNHDYSINHVLLFTGNMNYAPNVDGVLYFCKEILPLIKEELPGVTFIIAGQKPVESVCALRSDSIEVTGFVPDISVYYKRAAVVVSPLRIGAGTQNKVLEAMAMGVPVVCGSIGFEGLGVESGEGVFMETQKHAFANRVISLLKNETQREQVGKAGRKIILERYDWDILSKKLEHFLISLGENA